MDGDNAIDAAVEIKEENHYYPFGLKHKGYNNAIVGTDYPFGYLNQEENEELGLGWLTFRYRNYIPEIGRFFGVDPISEEYFTISTYQFAHNNPVWKIELEGLEGATINKKGKGDVITHEVVKYERTNPQEAFVGPGGLGPLVVTPAAEVAVETAITETAAGSSGGTFLGNLLKGGGILIGTLLMPQSSHAPGIKHDFMIDESFQLDNYEVDKVTGDSTSSIVRMGDWLDKIDSVCDAPSGCEDVADEGVLELGDGAEYLQITPRIGRFLGPVNGTESGWSWHVAAYKNGRVYDRLTGAEGMRFNDYMRLFDYWEDLNFKVSEKRTLN